MWSVLLLGIISRIWVRVSWRVDVKKMFEGSRKHDVGLCDFETLLVLEW